MINSNIFIFHHIPKTGGSSLWHNLVTSSNSLYLVDDVFEKSIKKDEDLVRAYSLYHNDKISSNEEYNRVYDIMHSVSSDILASVSKIPNTESLLLHHHSDVYLKESFSGAKYIASIRDPISRFKSYIRHIRKFYLNINIYSKTDNSIINELHNIAHQEINVSIKNDVFTNYYRRWFSGILFSRDELRKMHDLPTDDQLLERIDANFISIPILYDEKGFEDDQLLYLSDVMGIGIIEANKQKIIRTVTKKELLTEEEAVIIDNLGEDLFSRDYQLYNKVKKWQESNKTINTDLCKSDIRNITKNKVRLESEFKRQNKVLRILENQVSQQSKLLSDKEVEISFLNSQISNNNRIVSEIKNRKSYKVLSKIGLI